MIGAAGKLAIRMTSDQIKRFNNEGVSLINSRTGEEFATIERGAETESKQAA
jgi:hypothetical protein